MIFPPQKCPPKSVQNHPLPWSSTSRSSLNPWNSESPSHPIPRDILLSTLGSDSPGRDAPLHIHLPCLATPNGFRTDLFSHKKKGRERKGRDRKTSICPNTVSQSTWTGPNPGNVMKPVFFVFPPHCPPTSLPASVLCPSSFFFLSPALHQEYQCYKEWFPHYYWSLLLGWHSAWHPCSWDTHTLSLSHDGSEGFTPNFRDR